MLLSEFYILDYVSQYFHEIIYKYFTVYRMYLSAELLLFTNKLKCYLD